MGPRTFLWKTPFAARSSTIAASAWQRLRGLLLFHGSRQISHSGPVFLASILIDIDNTAIQLVATSLLRARNPIFRAGSFLDAIIFIARSDLRISLSVVVVRTRGPSHLNPTYAPWAVESIGLALYVHDAFHRGRTDFNVLPAVDRSCLIRSKTSSRCTA